MDTGDGADVPPVFPDFAQALRIGDRAIPPTRDGRDNAPMTEHQDHREGQRPGQAVYVALGRFVVEFSQVVDAMQDGMIRVAAGDNETARTAWTAALSADVAADQTTRMFFAVCSSLAELDDGEKQIRKLLRGRVEDLTKRRNAISHGVWHMPVLHAGRDKAEWVWDQPSFRYGRAGKDGISMSEPVTVEEADALADEAHDLAPLLHRFAVACVPEEPHRVRDRLQVRDGRVVRRNPPKQD
jgi:hypothetical protein